MEIYKLKDFEGGSETDFRITGLKQGVKNPDRVNIYVNSRFAFSLDVTQVVDFKIKVGLVLSAEKLEELKQASEFGKLYQRTLEWVLTRPRSEKEARDYLSVKLKKSSSDMLLRARRYGAQSLNSLPVGRERSSDDIFELTTEIIERLRAKGYLNDEDFAKWWVENRFVKKGVSKKRLKMELLKKGVSLEIVDEVLDVRDDEEEIMKIIAKKRAKYDDEKLIQYLLRQGFPFELVREKVQSYEMD